MSQRVTDLSAQSGTGQDDSSHALAVRDLRVDAGNRDRPVRLLDGIDLDLRTGESVGIIGESGSGKSLLVRSIAGLLPPGVRVTAGHVTWAGTDLTRASEASLCRVRGRQIGMVFQDAIGSLDPLFTVGQQLTEAMKRHQSISARQARRLAQDLLDLVGIAGDAGRLRSYPHELSGGMAQRVAIAIAIANSPRLLIADEATTALDVTIQQQIIALIRRIQRERSCGVLFVSHDLATVASLVDRIVVMYAGRIVEEGTTAQVLRSPRHPYTAALIDSKPRLGAPDRTPRVLQGGVPLPGAWPRGCRFHPRCPIGHDRDICAEQPPPLAEVASSHHSACHFFEETRSMLHAKRSETEHDD